MRKIVSARPRGEIATPARDEVSDAVRRELRGADEPSPLWALAVGLVYVFRTAPGHRVLRDLERAVRRYAADPAALWRLVRDGDRDIVDSTARVPRELPTRNEPAADADAHADAAAPATGARKPR
jgi:hypothetical protein